MNELAQALHVHEVFHDLNPAELDSLVPLLDRATFQEGEVVFDINRKPHFLFFIESGSFTLQLANNDYKSLQPGQLMGEIGIINDEFRTGTVTAAEASTVIRICGRRLFNPEFLPAELSLKIFT